MILHADHSIFARRLECCVHLLNSPPITDNRDQHGFDRLSAPLDFMLLVATPPNAIIYGFSTVTIKEMLRAVFLLDVIGIVTVALLAVTIGLRVFAGV